MRNLVIAATVVAVASLAGAPAARATVVVVPTLEEMAVASDVIADARVLDQLVKKDELGRILTLTRVTVVDGLKGAKTGDTLEIFQLGGNLDGKNAWIVGAQHFQKGERFVIFAARHPSGGPASIVPYGIGFGVFDVVTDNGPVKNPRVQEVVGDVVSLSKSDDGAVHEKSPDVRTFDSLPAFKETIQRALTLQELPKLPMKQKLAPHLRGRP